MPCVHSRGLWNAPDLVAIRADRERAQSPPVAGALGAPWPLTDAQEQDAPFAERLAKLGYGSYDHYLASEHWELLKARWRNSGRPQACAACDRSPVELHHWTYERLGREWLEDLVALCRRHHEEVHLLVRRG